MRHPQQNKKQSYAFFSAGNGLLAVPQEIGNDPCRTDVLLFMTFLFFWLH